MPFPASPSDMIECQALETARDALTAMLSSANDARAAELSRADDELADSNALQVCPRLLAFVRSRRRVVERRGPQKEALP